MSVKCPTGGRQRRQGQVFNQISVRAHSRPLSGTNGLRARPWVCRGQKAAPAPTATNHSRPSGAEGAPGRGAPGESGYGHSGAGPCGLPGHPPPPRGRKASGRDATVSAWDRRPRRSPSGGGVWRPRSGWGAGWRGGCGLYGYPPPPEGATVVSSRGCGRGVSSRAKPTVSVGQPFVPDRGRITAIRVIGSSVRPPPRQPPPACAAVHPRTSRRRPRDGVAGRRCRRSPSVVPPRRW